MDFPWKCSNKAYFVGENEPESVRTLKNLFEIQGALG